jgi:hypothetical protein
VCTCTRLQNYVCVPAMDKRPSSTTHNPPPPPHTHTPHSQTGRSWSRWCSATRRRARGPCRTAPRSRRSSTTSSRPRATPRSVRPSVLVLSVCCLCVLCVCVCLCLSVLSVTHPPTNPSIHPLAHTSPSPAGAGGDREVPQGPGGGAQEPAHRGMMDPTLRHHPINHPQNQLQLVTPNQPTNPNQI